MAKNSLSKKKRRVESIDLVERHYIFSEGTETEPNYFNGFRYEIGRNPIYKNLVEIIVSPVGKGTSVLYNEANKRIKNEGINNSQIWYVFDKDNFTVDSFNGTISKIESKSDSNKYHACWSNQSFEFWFILHFSNYQSDNDRKYYIDTLNSYFHEIGGYKKNDERIFYRLLEKGNPKKAIKFAKKRIAENQGKQPSQIAPATKVYELVEELAKYLPNDIRVKFLE